MLSEVIIVADGVVENNEENILFNTTSPIVISSRPLLIMVTSTGGQITIQDNDGKIKSTIGWLMLHLSWYLYSLLLEIEVGFTRISSIVEENVGTLEVCAIIMNGSIAEDYTGPNIGVMLIDALVLQMLPATGNKLRMHETLQSYVCFKCTCMHRLVCSLSHSDGLDFSVDAFDRNILFTTGSITGNTSCTTVTIINDTIAEPDEYFRFGLMSNQIHQVGISSTMAMTTVRIIDDDSKS